MADALDSASHDRCTRRLQGPWSGHIRLHRALRARFTIVGGSLLLDETVVDKLSARFLGAAAWVWSRQQNKGGCGGSMGLLVWPAGQVRLPRAVRLWRKAGPSQDDLALA
jgi:hypothetical protein